MTEQHKAALKAAWAKPEVRQRHVLSSEVEQRRVQNLKKAQDEFSYRDNMSLKATNNWQNSKYREKCIAGQKAARNPEVEKRRAESNKKVAAEGRNAGVFKKGTIPWNKNKPFTPVHKNNCVCSWCRAKRGEYCGDANPAKKLGVGKKISEKKMGHEVSEATRQKLSIKHTGKVLSIDTKLKIGDASKEHWSNSEYIAKQAKHGNGRFMHGEFKSYKNKCDIRFQSSYELLACIKLEHDVEVVAYGRCHFSIPYLFNGTARRYVPDIMVEYTDGHICIIEVKPKDFVNDPINIAKYEALDRYCRENNMSCCFWTEDDLTKEESNDQRTA